MDYPFVIGVSGTIGSGKDTVAGMLSSVLVAEVEIISFSQLLIAEQCEPQGLPPTRETLQRLGLATPPEWFHERAAERIRRSSRLVFAIPNIRRQADAAFIRHYDYHCLIAVEIDERIAYQRAAERVREADPQKELSLAEFKAMRSAPIEAEIPVAMGLADITLENNGSLEDLRQALFANREKLQTTLNLAVLHA